MDSGVRTVGNREEMQAVAAEIAQQLNGGDVILLYGELGSGKTTFVQGLARALGITTGPVTSPTFVIVSEYAVGEVRGITTLIHVDLYRLDATIAAADPAVRDVIEQASDPGRLTIIEWADRLGDATPVGAKKISFQHGKSSHEHLIYSS